MFDNFSHPLFLSLFVLFLGFLIARKSRYFLRHASVAIIVNAQKRNRGRGIMAALPPFCRYLGFILLILAAADYCGDYEDHYQKNLIHHYVLLNDGSGSMVSGGEKNGVGERLKALLNGNDKFLATLEKLKRPDGSKDWVAAAIFSNDAFVVSYPTEDYNFVREKLRQVDWTMPPLNHGTEIDKAVWLGIKIILKKNSENKGTFYLEDELTRIGIYTMGGGRQFDLKNLSVLQTKTAKIKNEIRGSSLVIFTDAEILFDGNQFRMSVAKLFLFCKALGIRAYLISVEQIDADLARYIKETGGDSLVISNISSEKITTAYANIVNKEAGEYITVSRRQKKSYAEWLAGTGLALLTVCIMLRNTMSRSLTEI